MNGESSSESGKSGYEKELIPPICQILITDADPKKLQAQEATACPRRYCVFWLSHSFEWLLSPEEGCSFLLIPKKGYRHATIPCCRSILESEIDHFIPSQPDIDEDGVDVSQSLEARAQRSKVMSRKHE